MSHEDYPVLYHVSAAAIGSALVDSVGEVDALANSVTLNNSHAHLEVLWGFGRGKRLLVAWSGGLR